jgi:hypothetical protein
MQQTYLEGLAQDPDVPFTMTASSADPAPGAGGPQARTVEAGAQVFDIRAMIADLENNPDARKRT